MAGTNQVMLGNLYLEVFVIEITTLINLITYKKSDNLASTKKVIDNLERQFYYEDPLNPGQIIAIFIPQRRYLP